MADGQKWAMTGEVWAKCAATATNGAGSPLALDFASKTMLGFPYEVTEDVGANSLFFGNWASVVIGVWGNGVDVAMSDAALFTSGGVTLRALQDVDVMVRLGQALAYNAAVTS
jgi:HK97 family phage major capsid protein